MKKIIYALMSICIIGFECNIVFCSTGLGTGDTSANVTVGIIDVPNIYDVDIAWGEMKFVHESTESFVWNAETHEYSLTNVTDWAATGNSVSVNNKSNYTVGVVLQYNGEEEYSSIIGTFDKNNFELAENEQEIAVLTLSGSLNSSVVSFTKIGSILITVE